ncbi:MAG: anthranilate synthase component I family protein [Parvularculaceae bacterium]
MRIREIDWRSPLAAFAPLAAEPFACLLHAGERAVAPGWSILAAFPSAHIERRRGRTEIDGEACGNGAFETLREAHVARRGRDETHLGSPFQTGLIGFVGYELGAETEPAAKGPPSPFAAPDLAFGAFDATACFDRTARRAYVVGRDDRALRRLEEALGREPVSEPAAVRFQPARSNFSREEYRQAVAGAIGLIRDGAFFQANLSQQISTESVDRGDPFAIFARLAEGAAPFGAFIAFEGGAILSNSPERFFSVSPDRDGWRVRAEPIKGTRRRAADAEEDARLIAELLASGKERAENVMIADLTRNDLSRICEDRSILEEDICALQSGPDIHHLVSRISGRLKAGLTAADALRAMFPCGSVTGAPKIEAMKAIARIEKRGRGPYCGAIGYIDDRGNADFSVAIRIMIAESVGGKLRITIPVGGGVTLRSDPDAEYEETLLKARTSMNVLGLAGT